jgi:hypothetical protein
MSDQYYQHIIQQQQQQYQMYQYYYPQGYVYPANANYAGMQHSTVYQQQPLQQQHHQLNYSPYAYGGVMQHQPPTQSPVVYGEPVVYKQKSRHANKQRQPATDGEQCQQYTCDTCEKTFPHRKMFESHLGQHVKCSQCDYAAAKRLVVSHEQAVHAITQPGSSTTGKTTAKQPLAASFLKVRTMDSPEEISRWIEARRRNYPTEHNIQAKQQQQKPADRRAQKRRMNDILNTFRAKKPAIADDETAALPVANDAGNMGNPNGDSYNNNDDDGDNNNDDDGPPEELGVSQRDHAASDHRNTIRCRYASKGRCRKGPSCPYKHDGAAVAVKGKQQQQQQKKIKPTLFDKLLQQDISRERLIVLDAIRLLLSQGTNDEDCQSDDASESTRTLTSTPEDGELAGEGENESSDSESSVNESSDNESSDDGSSDTDNYDTDSESTGSSEDGLNSDSEDGSISNNIQI